MDWWDRWDHSAVTGNSPLRMDPQWLLDSPLVCVRCRRAIRSEELFWPRGWCAMTGVIELAQMDAYGDMLEPVGEHVDCDDGTDSRT